MIERTNPAIHANKGALVDHYILHEARVLKKVVK